MKNISINLLTNVVLLLAGVLLIIFYKHPDLLDWVARIIGMMFLLPSIAYLMSVAMRHMPERVSNDYLGVLPAIGGLCFGIIMLAKPQLFNGVLSIFMGALLIVLGLFHVIYLFLSRKDIKVKGWYYLLPLIVTVYGLLILFVDGWRAHEDNVVLMTGIGLLMFNCTSVLVSLAERRARRNAPTLPRIDDTDDDMPTPPPHKPADDTGKDCDHDPEAEKYLHTEI
jgi:uncharacterized membrane protein HdeD (DUF308 family)